MLSLAVRLRRSAYRSECTPGPGRWFGGSLRVGVFLMSCIVLVWSARSEAMLECQSCFLVDRCKTQDQAFFRVLHAYFAQPDTALLRCREGPRL